MPGTRKLGKTTDQRMAMLRQQVTDFLDNGRMETTVTRAKEIKPLAEKMITLGKKGDLAAYRQALSFITREDVANKLFKELAPSYAERNGGDNRPLPTRGPRRLHPHHPPRRPPRRCCRDRCHRTGEVTQFKKYPAPAHAAAGYFFVHRNSFALDTVLWYNVSL